MKVYRVSYKPNDLVRYTTSKDGVSGIKGEYEREHHVPKGAVAVDELELSGLSKNGVIEFLNKYCV